jgi:hypothetical protein
MILTECVFVLARIALADREMFLRLVSAASQVGNFQQEKVWEAILDQFWRQVRNPPPCLLIASCVLFPYLSVRPPVRTAAPQARCSGNRIPCVNGSP